MEEIQKPDIHGTSAAAFMEGGILDVCDDACSICLDEFSESNPSTVTNCKHEFHLQCILEWCQRSSQCPMCWQAISLKEPTSQELLEAVEKERSLRVAPRVTTSRNTTIFHHPTLGDFELQHLPVGVNDPELEERIIQHLAAAAAMGRTRHAARREDQRRSSAHSHPRFLVCSTHPSPQHSGSVSSSPLAQIGGETETATNTVASPSTPLTSGIDQQMSPNSSGQNTPSSRSTVTPTNRRGYSFNNRNTSSDSSLPNQERAGPSEFQSFSESLKSRFNSVSLKYKESISKSTRGWKERWFSRNSSMSDIGNEVRREVSAGIASVSRMVERLENGETRSEDQVSLSNNLAESSVLEQDNQHNTTRNNNPTAASHAESSLSD